MNRRRILLLGVAGLLLVSALLAIGILLVGRFGGTQGRILGSTALLAGCGLVALPGVVLLDQGRGRLLALASLGLTALAGAVALASIWGASEEDALGKSVGTTFVFALAAAQAAALASRRQERDPPTVQRLFPASCATALVAAVMIAALIWANPHGDLAPRLLGALVVLDLLLAALQPVLARARPAAVVHSFAVVLASGETTPVTIEGGDLATAAAKAIRAVERSGGRVVRLDVADAERPRA